MPEFSAHKSMEELKERGEQLEHGDRLVPIAASIIAVLAALGTLISNHASTSALSEKNEAVLYTTKSADMYNYYEASRVKVMLNQSLISAGVATDAAARKSLQTTAAKEQKKANHILMQATDFDKEAAGHGASGERIIGKYESAEYATTLFEVAVVLVSISALTRTRLLLAMGGLGTAIGLIFFVRALLQ